MSLVFAGIVPHPPTLIPELARSAVNDLEITKEAFTSLEQDLYLAKPDVLIVISAYTGNFPDAFSINAEPKFTANFEQFGDFSITSEWQGATDFAALLYSHSHISHIPVKMISNPTLDSGVTIPLHILGSHLEHIQILPVGFSNLDVDAHVSFGNLIREECQNSNKRIAILVSGHLSGATGPAIDTTYDQTIRKALSDSDYQTIQHLNQTVVDASQTSLHKGLTILSGIIGEGQIAYKEYSYEAPHGVGYLVSNIDVS